MILVGPISRRSGCGYIDSEGQIRIPFCYEELGEFSEGLAWFRIENRIGFIDMANSVVIAPRFYRNNRVSIVSDFRSGLAVAGQGGKEGYIDRTGEFRIPCQFEVGSPFVGGIAVVSEGGGFSVIDLNGTALCRLDFSSVAERPYAEDCIKVYDFDGEEHCPALVNRFGRILLGPFRGLEEIGRFSKDSPALAWALQRATQRTGFMDQTGEIVIPFIFSQTTGFSEGLAAVSNAEHSWGYIDGAGNWVIAPKYSWAYPFLGDTAVVQTGRRKTAKWQIIRRDGSLALPESFDGLLLETRQGYRAFRRGESIAVLDPECRIIWTGEI